MIKNEKHLQDELADLIKSLDNGVEVDTEVSVHNQEHGTTTKRGYTTVKGFVSIADVLVQIEGAESIAFECKGESKGGNIQRLQRGVGQCLYYKLSGAVPCLVIPNSLVDSRVDEICRQSDIGLLVIGGPTVPWRDDLPDFDLRRSHDPLLSALFMDAQSQGFDCRIDPSAHQLFDN